jgi:hypothetical protein
MDSPIMEFFAKGLGKRGYRVARFEYPYMAAQRVTGQRKPPDREPVLREAWMKVIEQLGREGLVIGGESLPAPLVPTPTPGLRRGLLGRFPQLACRTTGRELGRVGSR